MCNMCASPSPVSHQSSWFPFLAMFPINKPAPEIAWEPATLECFQVARKCVCVTKRGSVGKVFLAPLLFLRWTDGPLLTWVIGKQTATAKHHHSGTLHCRQTLHVRLFCFFFSIFKSLKKKKKEEEEITLKSSPPLGWVWRVTCGTNHHIPSPYTVRKISGHELCLPWWVWSRQNAIWEASVNTNTHGNLEEIWGFCLKTKTLYLTL